MLCCVVGWPCERVTGSSWLGASVLDGSRLASGCLVCDACPSTISEKRVPCRINPPSVDFASEPNRAPAPPSRISPRKHRVQHRFSKPNSKAADLEHPTSSTRRHYHPPPVFVSTNIPQRTSHLSPPAPSDAGVEGLSPPAPGTFLTVRLGTGFPPLFLSSFSVLSPVYFSCFSSAWGFCIELVCLPFIPRISFHYNVFPLSHFGEREGILVSFLHLCYLLFMSGSGSEMWVWVGLN